MLLERGGERLHRFDGIQVHHGAAQLADGLEILRGEKFLLLARAALGDVNGRIEPAIRELAVEDQLHVARAFELLENQLVHARTGVHQRRGEDGQRAAFLDLARGGEHLARDFQRTGIHAAGHRAAAAAVDAVVGAGHAGDGVEQHEYILARLHDAAAALDDEARKADVRVQVLVVRGGDDLRLHRALEVGNFLGALVNEQHDAVDFGVVDVDGVGDLFEDGGLAGARQGDDEAARAFADGRDEVNDPRLDEVGRGFEVELLDGINRGQVLEAHDLGVVGEGDLVHGVHRLELRAVATVRRLRRPGHEAALAEEMALDGVGRDKDIRRLGAEMIWRRAQKAETFFRDFEITGAVIGHRGNGWLIVRVAHKITDLP